MNFKSSILSSQPTAPSLHLDEHNPIYILLVSAHNIETCMSYSLCTFTGPIKVHTTTISQICTLAGSVVPGYIQQL